MRARAAAFIAVLAMTSCSSGHKAAPPTTIQGTTSTVATTTTIPGPTQYTVKQGDTLTSISKQFHVPVSKIIDANKLAHPDQLKPGDELKIPPPPVIKLTVQPSAGVQGDTFQLKLEGVQPLELITFHIRSPNGKTFTGPGHFASTDGVVSTVYRTSFSEALGAFTVSITGDQGSAAQAHFIVRRNESLP
ncbi:MAG TPA: LysM domain-containing protein [Acidimicrobiia bacterium]|nr:LysM domain-containing protein [Acidimicrobiia bacterium]